jgi:hypothetical protein
MGGFRFGGPAAGGGGGGALEGTVLKYADKTAVAGSGLTWGDNGNNLTLDVAIASGTGTKPQHFMGYALWDTGFVVSDLPTLSMRMTRVSSPTSQVTGPPVMLCGFVCEDAAGNVDFTSSISRWGGIRWANGSNGENNHVTSTLRANQTPAYSSSLFVDTSSPTNYGLQQHIQFLMRRNIPNSAGTAGGYFTHATYSIMNYPATNGNGTAATTTKNESLSGALTATDKIFWFIGVFRHGNVGNATVSLEFNMVASAVKRIL